MVVSVEEYDGREQFPFLIGDGFVVKKRCYSFFTAFLSLLLYEDDLTEPDRRRYWCGIAICPFLSYHLHFTKSKCHLQWSPNETFFLIMFLKSNQFGGNSNTIGFVVVGEFARHRSSNFPHKYIKQAPFFKNSKKIVVHFAST